MPTKPPRISHSCPPRPPWQRHGLPPARIRGRQLQRLRALLFSQQPLCVQCQAEGRITVATIRDHIQPLEEGGPDTQANCQPLCQAHSDAKTAAESRRGHARSRIPVTRVTS